MTCRVQKSPTKPDFILGDVYEDWTEKWEDSAFKTLSEKMKANRGRASTHTGGSRSFCNHADFLNEKFQVDDISSHTLFQHNHSRGHDMKTWVSAKAHSVEEAYQAEVASSADNGTPLTQTEAFFKAAGGRKKGGVYGIGDTMNIYYGSSSGSSMQSESTSGRSLMGEMEQLRQALKVERAEREKMQAHTTQW